MYAWRSTVVEWFRALDLKSCAPDFKLLSDHQLALFQVVPDSIPQLRLYVGSWSVTKCGYLLILIHITYLYYRKSFRYLSFQVLVALLYTDIRHIKSLLIKLKFIRVFFHNASCQSGFLICLRNSLRP